MSMQVTRTMRVRISSGTFATLMLCSVSCMAFKHPSRTQSTVDVTVHPSVNGINGVITTTPIVDVTVHDVKPLPPPQYALWEGVDAALKALQQRGESITFDTVMEELYVMHKNNDIHLPFDPYWRGKMKRPLTNKKREKAAFEEALRKRLEMFNRSTSETTPIPDPAPKPSQFSSKERFVRAYVAYKNANVDDRTRAQYRRKIGGMADYRRDMQREAARLWAKERGR